jgi:succinate-semialdehyde dehydrogenase/glutarate-semialdehyde dehydrogenase
MPITDALNAHLKDKSLLKAAAYVGGRWLETAENGTTFEVTNPSTGKVLAVLPNCGVAEAKLAIAAAEAAQGGAAEALRPDGRER